MSLKAAVLKDDDWEQLLFACGKIKCFAFLVQKRASSGSWLRLTQKASLSPKSGGKDAFYVNARQLTVL